MSRITEFGKTLRLRWWSAIAIGVLLCAGNVKADTLTGTPTPVVTTEGVAFSGALGMFTDTNTGFSAGDFTAAINWGDGKTSAGTVTGSNGSFTVSGTHSYAPDEGSFLVSTIFTQMVGTSLSVTVSAPGTVNEGDTFAGAGTMFYANLGTVFTGAVATFTDTNPNNVLSDFTTAINWGDGTTSAGTLTLLNGVFTVTGGHTYANEGTFTTSVVLSDDAPGTASETVTGTANVGVISTPEPATFTLLGCGLVALSRVVRRRPSPRS